VIVALFVIEAVPPTALTLMPEPLVDSIEPGVWVTVALVPPETVITLPRQATAWRSRRARA
jgi:hypothetical protein